MNGNFFNYIKDIKLDIELFDLIITNFPSFKDEREYMGEKIYFYKLAQLLTSDILHLRKIKENIEVDFTNLIGCSDYKIPQVLNNLNILNYDEKLKNMIVNKIEIKENSEEEIEIRSSVIIVIDYIYNKLNKKISRIDINDCLWLMGWKSNKTPYHLTRTVNY